VLCTFKRLLNLAANSLCFARTTLGPAVAETEQRARRGRGVERESESPLPAPKGRILSSLEHETSVCKWGPLWKPWVSATLRSPALGGVPLRSPALGGVPSAHQPWVVYPSAHQPWVVYPPLTSPGWCTLSHQPWVVYPPLTSPGWCTLRSPALGGVPSAHQPWVVVPSLLTSPGWCTSAHQPWVVYPPAHQPWVVYPPLTSPGWCTLRSSALCGSPPAHQPWVQESSWCVSCRGPGIPRARPTQAAHDSTQIVHCAAHLPAPAGKEGKRATLIPLFVTCGAISSPVHPGEGAAAGEQ